MSSLPTDLRLLAVAERTYLRTAPADRRLLELYIDWLTDRIAAAKTAASPQSAPTAADERR
jgi:hypothetical protein